MMINRRNILKGLVGTSLYSGFGIPAISNVLAQTSGCNRTNGQGVLVVIFQRGGNDGVNMLIPINSVDHQYYKNLRPNIGYDIDETLAVDANYGLNPYMQGLHQLTQQGHVTFFPGTHVGVPNTPGFLGSMSHFAAQDIMEAGGTGSDIKQVYQNLSNQDNGWISRAFPPSSNSESCINTFGFGAYKSLVADSGKGVFISGEPELGIPSAYSVDPFLQKHYTELMQIRSNDYASNSADTYQQAEEFNRLQLEFFKKGGDLQDKDFITDAQEAKAIGYNTYDPTGEQEFMTPLALDMAATATLIANYPELNVVALNNNVTGNRTLKDYDTHGSQRARQDALLEDLSINMSAFHNHIEQIASNKSVEVIVVTEFGRTLDENNSGGTDHGQAFTAFSMGAGSSSLKTQKVAHGRLATVPSLKNDYSFQQGSRVYVQPIQDYRDIISEILLKRCGINVDTSANPFYAADQNYNFLSSNMINFI